MSLTARFLCLLLFIPLIGSNSAPAQARNVPLVTGRYKYLPAKVPVGLTLITDSRFTVKHRPANYGLRHLSSRSLTNSISARSAMVMDAVSGDIIYTINPDLPRQPASTIKVLNGIISIDSLRKNDLVPVSRRAAGMPRSKIYLRPGHKYRAGDLINAMLLASANDASVALAEKIGGTERTFAKLMTARARSLGATHTVCKSASGLTRRGQYTTARDLAKIFNYAMRNPIFARTMERTKIRTSYGKIIRSHNRALWQVKGAEGGKTGYTYLARQTYVGSFKRGNDELVVAIMGSETMWNDLKKLVRFGFAKKARTRRTLALTRRPKSFKLVQLGGRDTLAHFTTVQ
ncbi:MAG: D-alanyl-D-alanine carboxypeptidase [Deltaproteobacteria bacterium]|nr:D-alanyl-D-alanine carboxypeptidase [Deltaproteobacteria bacterium]